MKRQRPEAGAVELRPATGSAGQGSGTVHMPRIDMERGHRRMLQACEALEALADQLPGDVDRLGCLMLASTLIPLLDACHGFEEAVVLPAFARTQRNVEIVSRLKAEHLQDRCAAEDLAEALAAYGHGRPISNPEAFGYMLRAFFDSMRRHIAFERDHVLPALAPEI